METIDKGSLAAALQGISDGFAGFVHDCYTFYMNERIGKEIPNNWTPWGSRFKDFEIYVSNIVDVELKGMFLALMQESEKLENLNQRWAEAFTQFFEISMPENYEERGKFRRKIERHRKVKGPSWLTVPVCQQLTVETQQIVMAVDQIKPQLDERLSLLYGHFLITNEQLGDQRAKDLIDDAEDEIDHQKAIRMLKRALRYGQTGIQASKAYMYLGMRYEDLGDVDPAIEHYSKAMEAWKPSALLYFWRGQLYYQQQQWAKAKDDLEMALAGDLSSPEREEAKESLAGIDKHIN